MLFFVACGGDTIQINEETDKTIMQLHKSENNNKVIYSVQTDGHCSVLNVFAYWKMDNEDGHTETLKIWEESLYDISNFKTEGTNVTFSFQCFPQKKVKIIIEESKPNKEKITYCSFLGVGDIDGKFGITKLIEIDNDGWDVKKANIKGVDFKNRSLHLIEELPTECQ